MSYSSVKTEQDFTQSSGFPCYQIEGKSGGKSMPLSRASDAISVKSSFVSSSSPFNTNTAVQYLRKTPDINVVASDTMPMTNSVFQPYPQFIGLNQANIQVLQRSSNMFNSVPDAASQPAWNSSANSKRSCNCTKSHCLKLYCECFSQGQLCQNCSCNNCMNNLGYEEERGRAIKMTLDRNPLAFHPKIGKGEGERKHKKGCNCKRSGCLKKYCECYEAKISCSNLCRCHGCHNTEDSMERRSLMRLAAMGALGLRRTNSFKTSLLLQSHDSLPHTFFTWDVIEAATGCLLAKAEEVERRALSSSAQERVILEEFGRSIDRVIETSNQTVFQLYSPHPASVIEDNLLSIDTSGSPRYLPDTPHPMGRCITDEKSSEIGFDAEKRRNVRRLNSEYDHTPKSRLKHLVSMTHSTAINRPRQHRSHSRISEDEDSDNGSESTMPHPNIPKLNAMPRKRNPNRYVEHGRKHYGGV